MKGILTQEGLDSLRWYMSEHPLKLGKKENKLEIFLRTLGLGKSSRSHPSDEQILRMYREEQIKTKLRKVNSIYNKVPSGLKSAVGYAVDILNIRQVKGYVDHFERYDEIAEGVIMTIPYRR